MNAAWKVWTITSGLGVAAIMGCAVDQTQGARAPDVDVEVDPGRWPQYDVKWADIDVGTTERTITVPVVRIEEQTRTMSVPYIDINPPGAEDRAERVVSIDVDVPHAGYEVQIVEVRASGDDLWVIGRLRETGTPRRRIKTRMSDQVVVNAPRDLDVRTIVVGERLEAGETGDYQFVDSMDRVEEIVPTGARLLYRRNALVPPKDA